MNTTFKVVFKYDEEPVNDIMRSYTQQAYYQIYNAYCKIINNKFDIWNKEFDVINPDIQEDNTDPDSKYMRYIVNNEQSLVDLYINPLVRGNLEYIDGFFIGEEADLRMKFKDFDGKTKTMQMFLKAES